jgi:hypothetical protein
MSAINFFSYNPSLGDNSLDFNIPPAVVESNDNTFAEWYVTLALYMCVITTDDASHRLSPSTDANFFDAKFWEAYNTTQTIDSVESAASVTFPEWADPTLVFGDHSVCGAYDHGHPEVASWDALMALPPSIESPLANLSSSASPSTLSPASITSYDAESPASLVLHTTESGTATTATSSLLGNRDFVLCEWAGCNTFISRNEFDAHFNTIHQGQVPREAPVPQPCLWAGCTTRKLLTHVRRHALTHVTEWSCDQCGDVFSRKDAVTRHRKMGSCVKCPTCKVTFGSVADKVSHVALGCSKQGTSSSGAPRRIKAKAARAAAHPYLH